MTKSDIPNKELDRFLAQLHQNFKTDEVDTPSDLDLRVKSMASEVAEKLRQRQADQNRIQDEFLVLAAAEDTETKARKLKSKSGDWTLWIYEDDRDPNQGTIVMQLHEDRFDEWKGRHVEVSIGGTVVISGELTSDEIEGDVLFSELDMSGKWHVSW